MRTIPNLPNDSVPAPRKTLDQLVSILAAGALPSAVRRKSFIVNDVPQALPLAIDENLLASILSGMLHTIVSNTGDSCVRVAAKKLGNIILVQVRHSNRLNRYDIARELKETQNLAREIGGCVSLGNKKENSTSIGFSFMNLPGTN